MCALGNNTLLGNTGKMPSNVMGVAGNSMVYLAWNRPNNIPISTITDYSVQYSSNNGTTWTTFSKPSSTTTSCVVSGLINNTSYIFRVAAVSNFDTGRYSVPSSVITPSDISSIDLYVLLADNTLGSINTKTQDVVINNISVNDSPGGLAVNKNTNKIYITNGNNVSVIDMISNQIIKTIPWNDRISQLAINYSTNRIYGIDGWNKNRVVVIDGNTDSITGTINVGTNPFGIAINNVTNKVYVINNASTSNSVSVIDCVTNTVITTFSVSRGPCAIAINDQTNKIYITHDPRAVSVIDGNTNSFIKNIPTSNFNYRPSVCVNTATNRIYVCGIEGMWVINGDTDTTLQEVTAPAINPSPINTFPSAVDETLNQIYVGDSDYLMIFDGNSNTFHSGLKHRSITSTGFGIVPSFQQIVVDSESNKIYAAISVDINSNSRNRLVIMDGKNTSKFKPITNIETNPRCIGVNKITKKAYIANAGSNSVSVIDTITNSVIKTIPVGSGPFSVAINENNNRIYILNTTNTFDQAPSISIIDGLSDTVSGTLTMPAGSLKHMVINPMTNKLYVPIGSSPNQCVVIDTNSNNIVKTISLSVSGLGVNIAVNFISNEIYIATSFFNNVVVINGFNDTLSTTFVLPSDIFVQWIEANSFTNKIYVASGNRRNIEVIDGETKTTSRIIETDLGGGFRTININTNTNKLHMTYSSISSVRIMDLDTESLIIQDLIIPSNGNFI